MSDRTDPEVRRLAEEIQRAYERDLPVKSFELTDLTEWLVPTLLAFQSQREAAQEPTPVDRDVALRFIYARADILARGMGQAARKSLALGIADLFAQARREGREEGLREAQVGPLADHDCEPVVDLSHCFGEGRECRLGRLTRAPEGWEHETWCLHLRSPLKGEMIFLLNEGDFCAGVALAYAALGYHVNPEWVESVAAGKGWDHYEVGCYPKPDQPAPEAKE